VDPQQEINISPAVVGIMEDQMAIRAIAQRKSLLYTVDWNYATVPLNTPMVGIVVHPRARQTVTSGAVQNCQPTWLDFVTTPFAFWRGTLRYTLQIVCSPQHKGKLLIQYEPNIAQAALIGAATPINKQFTKVIDIQETQIVSFDVEWCYPRPWASNVTDAVAAYMVGSLGGSTGAMYEAANGFWTLAPLTVLQSPNTAGCHINIWVSCPDLMVTEPTDQYIPLKRVLFQCDDITLPADLECCTLNPTGAMAHMCCEHTFGEQVVSFRSLLHRFERTFAGNIAADGTVGKTINFVESIYPTAIAYTGTLTDATLFTYIRSAYLGLRGGMRKRFRIAGLVCQAMDNLTVMLNKPESSQTTPATSLTGAASATMNFRGGVTFVAGTNGGIEFELPYYSNNMFSFAQSPDPYISSNGSATYGQGTCLRNYTVQQETGASTPNMYVAVETAIADDFSFLRLVAPPPYGI